MGAVIRGKIVGQIHKRAIEEAVVTMSSPGIVRLVDIAQVTNDAGIFFWNDLAPGKYDILIVAEGYKTKKVSIRLNTNEEREIFIEL